MARALRAAIVENRIGPVTLLKNPDTSSAKTIQAGLTMRGRVRAPGTGRSALTLRGIAGLVVLLVPLARGAGAQPFGLTWNTVDGGGGTTSAGGPFLLGGTIGQPDAGGPFAGSPYVLHSGFWSLAAGGVPVAEADLSIVKTDGQTNATAGHPVSYTIVVANAGPVPVTGATVTDPPPAVLMRVSWTCTASAGSTCPASGQGGINHPVALLLGGSATFVLTGTIAPGAIGTLDNTAAVAPPAGVVDPVPANNSSTDTDVLLVVGESELSHGAVVRADLAIVGGALDVDLYRIRQEPYSSYEVVLDEGSGDLGASGPVFERVGSDGATLLQSAVAVGAGPARSLRFQNTTPSPITDQLLRVFSAPCGIGCGADDVYRLRAWETTLSIARFNNSSAQATVLILQNRASAPVSGDILFWSAEGVLLHREAFSLGARATFVLNTAGLSPLAGQGGSMTVAHLGPHGSIAGKAVAVEPATGFSFDSPLESRRR